MTNFDFWTADSLTRVFPLDPVSNSKTIELLAARGERVSFQACFRNGTTKEARVSLSVDDPGGMDVTVRSVGLAAVAHHNTDDDGEWDGVGKIPGYVPDPLYPESEMLAGPQETRSFWVSVKVPASTQPGEHTIRLRICASGSTTAELSARVSVSHIVVGPRKGFPVTHWFYADALCDWYKLQPYEEALWPIIGRYLRDMVAHGNNCVYVPLFTPPTDGVKRPHQLLKITSHADGRYAFDFADVRRWVRMAKEAGAECFEWTHLFTQWGVEHAIRVYKDNADPESLLWPADTGATSDTYRNFLSQFLPRFQLFLEGEGLMESSIFHVSDEPHGEEHVENYREARAMLAELAPWMKVHDALSDIRFAREGLTDFPVASITTAKQFVDEGFPALAYFCCGPRGKYLNRLMDTPLEKIRMSGWLFYRLKARGFLHWGYNYWYKSQTQQLIDPFSDQAGGTWPNWAHGDTFVVYPGADGPLDSIRWEVWAESLQDYALLQSAGILPDDDMLSGIKDYNEFPKSKEWITEARRSVLGVK